METAQLYTYFLKAEALTTDSRSIPKNSIFFALKGENFNGNLFAEEAIRKGAIYAVVDEEQYKNHPNIILVDNTLTALQQLANYHRKQIGIPIIALTGSNGKTTTKELIHSVLKTTYKTIATKGNLNNHIGVPLTLLSMTKETELGIVEMGANHLNEITTLCTIAEPDFGYITNFGKAHLEGFGGVEGVIKGKSELYQFLIKHQKTIFINADDPIQNNKTANYPRKFSFSHEHGDVIIKFINAQPFVELSVNNMSIHSQLIGSYNLNNIAAAAMIGCYFNVPMDNIKNAIENYTPTNNQSQIIEQNGRKIILDAYNANPSSMHAALDNFALQKETSKLAILGDMFELGEAAANEHQQIADYAASLVNTDVWLVGHNFSNTISSLKKFPNFKDLEYFLSEYPVKQKLLLIKGSRGMALERTIKFL